MSGLNPRSLAFMLGQIKAFRNGATVTLETPVAAIGTKADAQTCADTLKQYQTRENFFVMPLGEFYTVARWLGNRLLVLHECGALH